MDNCPLRKDKEIISSMFDSIAPKYDFINHTLSFRLDKYWRRKLIALVCRHQAGKVLDLACGTGDVSRGLARKGISVTGLDISTRMLEVAREKTDPDLDIRYQVGAADRIPFEDHSFDAVTISFGIRNFDHRAQCLQEIFRVIRPGGILTILEFTTPESRFFGSLYDFYLKRILPAIGGMITRNKKAYTYLHDSTLTFPQREAFCKEIREGGFKDVSYKELTMGVASIYIAAK